MNRSLQVYRTKGRYFRAVEDSPFPDNSAFLEAAAEIRSWPDYHPTPLRSLPGLAKRCGISLLHLKDESGRFGLGSFKALGGAYAVSSLAACAAADDETGERPIFACATDGNHGRAVAWGAREHGCTCVVFVPDHVSDGRRRAIEDFGASVEVVAGTYDDAVDHAGKVAAREGWMLVSDTSIGCPETTVARVLEGYRILAAEVIEQWENKRPPTHVFVQGGVGGLAAAISHHLASYWSAVRPRFVVVEPEKADCLYRSAVAGMLTKVPGDLRTVMSCLSCGEPSPLAWKVLRETIDIFMTIPDDAAVEAMRLLAVGAGGDVTVISGESGAAGIGAVLALQGDRAARNTVGLDRNSRVLALSTEGATDPELYAELVGVSPEAFP